MTKITGFVNRFVSLDRQGQIDPQQNTSDVSLLTNIYFSCDRPGVPAVAARLPWGWDIKPAATVKPVLVICCNHFGSQQLGTMMRRVGLAAMLVLAGSSANALDASGVDVLGLRLGMSNQEITAHLAAQGFSATTVPAKCPKNDACLVKATTKDGALLITLSGQAGVQRIDYAFRGHGQSESQRIQSAMTDRFGEPNQRTPMAWCHAVNTDGACPPEQPSLTFRSDTLTITLKSGTGEASD